MFFKKFKLILKKSSKRKYISNLNIGIFILLFLAFILITNSSVNAFSSYEKETAATLYDNLDNKYEIREFSEDEEAYKILERLEKSIIKKNFKDEEFTVHYIDDQTINAYYIGAGNIMIFEGILKELNTTEELAALIAHEIGHGAEEHLYEDLQRNLRLSVINILFNMITDQQYQTMTNVFQNLISRGYSREQEEEADIYAVDLMMRADYDPQGLLDLMKLFKEKSMNIKLLEFTQTHPIPDSRIEYLNEYIAQKKQAEKSKKPKNEIKNLDQAKKEEQEKMSFENNKEVKLKKELNNDIIKFNYPEEWDLEEEKSVDSQTIFKFHFNNQDTEGEFILQDLSFKDFMDTARKHYNYALLEAEAEGKMPNKSTRKINDLSIYRLQWSESDQFFYKYYLESEKSKKMLKISFVSDKDSLERREGVFERLINTVQFN